MGGEAGSVGRVTPAARSRAIILLDKVRASLELELDLAAPSTDVSLEEISARHGVSRSTAERMRNLIADMFGTLERIHEGKIVRFRLPNCPRGFSSSPRPRPKNWLN